MAFDAFYLSCVLEEIRRLPEPRVEKLHQPSRDTVLLHLRHREGRVKLLLVLNPAAPRLHLTQANPENPPEPPMFCMLLRKHLLGSRLVGVEQLPMERCAVFRFDCTDDFGDRVEKRLVCELMGRTCNLYLLSPEGRILDCLRRVGLDESSRRQALPGLFYQMPEKVEKLDPRTLTREDFAQILTRPGGDLLSQRLMDTLGGLSPLVCREAALQAAGDIDFRLENQDISLISQNLFNFFSQKPQPCFVRKSDGSLFQYAFCPITQYGPWEAFDSFSGLLDRFYSLRDRQDALRQKGQSLRKTAQTLCARLTKKIAIQEKELAATLDRERLRQLGDIVTANLHAIRKGQTVLTAEDFYDEAMALVDIPLSPLLSPQQNAAKFYKDYARMKTAQKELTNQLELARQELAYLRSVLEELDRADSEQALEEIRQELAQGGYVKAAGGKKRVKTGKMPPLRYESSDGVPIYVGRNNRQNDELTFKLARKDDLWLHVQKVPGSHVILACCGKPVSDQAVTEAAQLAAWHSSARQGQNVAVDVTAVKQIKKPPAGKPGMVIYHTYRTVYVNPVEREVTP